MKNSEKKIILSGGITAAVSAAAGAFLYYCEKMQLIPLTVKGTIGRLAIAAFISGLAAFLLFWLVRKDIESISKHEWLPVILVSLVLSVCVLVWFPIPKTGLYPSHTLTIRALPDADGNIRPVTLTWLHIQSGDVLMSGIRCEGNCFPEGNTLTIPDENTLLSWQGKPGDLATVEFKSDPEQGIAEIDWDGIKKTAFLNNNEFDRLSFDHAFPHPNGMPEFLVLWLISFLLCTFLVIGIYRLLPGWNLKIFGISVFILFICVRLAPFLSVSEPLQFIDSEFYPGQSRFTLAELLNGKEYCRSAWHCLARPILVPLVYKLCRQDLNTITIIQFVVSVISWGYFAHHAAGLARTDIGKKAILVLSLGLGCVPNITRWDQMIMSESLSLSAAMLLAGSLFRLPKPETQAPGRWRWQSALAAAVSALLFAFTRDSAVWTVFLTAVLLLCISCLRVPRKVIFTLCAFLFAVVFLIFAKTGDRWEYAFENVLFNRILNEPQGESFFIASGMPAPPSLSQLYGTEHAMAYPLFNSDEMRPLREWILRDGLKTYIRYMLQRPAETLRMAWYAGFEKEAFEKITYTYTPAGFRQILPDPLIKLFSCNLPGVLLIGLALAAIFKAFREPDGERFAFPVLFILSAYLLASAALIADEYEFDRHIVVILAMMKASAWSVIVMLWERKA